MNNTRACLFLCAGVLLAVMLAGGCSKQQPAAGSNAGSNAAASTAPQPPPSARSPGTPAAAAPVVVPDSGDVNATLGQLSLELRKYVVRTRSVPKNFEEFVSKSGAQVPAPPAGKKYAIQGQEVVLVKR
jgi:hypothetical protein